MLIIGVLIFTSQIYLTMSSYQDNLSKNKTTKVTEEIAKSSVELSQMAENLNQIIKQFKI